MLKKLVPLALVGLVAGCAAYQEALTFQNELQTFLVRSVTLNLGKGGTTDENTIALIWGGTKQLTSPILRGRGTMASQSIAVNPTSYFATDSVAPNGSIYIYKATFETGKTYTRYIQPYTTGDMGAATLTSPSGISLPPDTLSGTKPTFTWTWNGSKPERASLGFMVTVGSAGDPSNPQAAAITPLYTAFLDAASHSTGVNAYSVQYGTPSDMGAMTKEITEILGKMDSRFGKKDTDIAPLATKTAEPTKVYMLLVSPLLVDEKAVKFGVGAQDVATFQVQ